MHNKGAVFREVCGTVSVLNNKILNFLAPLSVSCNTSIPVYPSICLCLTPFDRCIQGANSVLNCRGRRSLSVERDEGRLRTERLSEQEVWMKVGRQQRSYVSLHFAS